MKNFKTIAKLCLSSILGGIFIAIAASMYLRIEDKLIGAIVFAFGLTSIYLFNLNLFTGKIGSIYYGDKYFSDRFSSTVGMLFILIFNFVGALTIAFMPVNAEALWASKLTITWYEAIGRGFICGIIIASTVFIKNIVRANKDKPIYMVLYTVAGVFAFIMAGSEHSIADMCYMIAARNFSAESWMFLLCVIAGNTIGGIVAMRAVNWINLPDKNNEVV